MSEQQQEQSAASPQPIAGRELDALVAEKLMGWVRWDDAGGDYVAPDGHAFTPFFAAWEDYDALPVYDPREDGWDGNVSFYFSPSADIAAAWTVVEKMRERGFRVRIELRRAGAYCDVITPDSDIGSARESTAPLAICLAALAAVNPLSARGHGSGEGTAERATGEGGKD